MVPPCHSLGVANSRVVSVCSPNIAIFSTQTRRLFFAYRRRRFPGNRRYNRNHDSCQRVPNLAHGRSEPSFVPIPLSSRPLIPCAAGPYRRCPYPAPAALCSAAALGSRRRLLRADSRPHLRRNRAAVAVSEGAPAAPLFAVQSRRPHTDSSIQTPPHPPPIRRVTRSAEPSVPLAS